MSAKPKLNPEKLTELQRRVLCDSGTEAPGTGELLHNKEKGTYHCAGCGAELFKSDTKFDSGTGWPSFWDANPEKVEKKIDLSMGIPRTEVRCKNCGGHLGHVFRDGPQPTGKRYCINSAALEFKKEEKETTSNKKSD